MKEELEDVYPGGRGTVLRVKGQSILLARSGRILKVMASFREISEGADAVDVTVHRVQNFDGNGIINSFLMLVAAGVGIFIWRSHVGDTHIELYKWIMAAVVVVLGGCMYLVALRDWKDSEGVFPESEVERLRTRLKLRIGTESIYSR
jgi:hypothetical protein